MEEFWKILEAGSFSEKSPSRSVFYLRARRKLQKSGSKGFRNPHSRSNRNIGCPTKRKHPDPLFRQTKTPSDRFADTELQDRGDLKARRISPNKRPSNGVRLPLRHPHRRRRRRRRRSDCYGTETLRYYEGTESSRYVCTWAIVLHCGEIDSAGGGRYHPLTAHPSIYKPQYTPPRRLRLSPLHPRTKYP
ncbi:hypothetical protein HN011_009584 [Eciton burchellii]|nr:hypothetical protein HN011_009584 [Eciton burchellii]